MLKKHFILLLGIAFTVVRVETSGLRGIAPDVAELVKRFLCRLTGTPNRAPPTIIEVPP